MSYTIPQGSPRRTVPDTLSAIDQQLKLATNPNNAISQIADHTKKTGVQDPATTGIITELLDHIRQVTKSFGKKPDPTNPVYLALQAAGPPGSKARKQLKDNTYRDLEAELEKMKNDLLATRGEPSAYLSAIGESLIFCPFNHAKEG